MQVAQGLNFGTTIIQQVAPEVGHIEFEDSFTPEPPGSREWGFRPLDFWCVEELNSPFI
jgi:hypothetical protein